MLQAELQQLRAQQEAQLAEREAERVEREAERQRLQALEVQQEGLLKFVQQIGQKQGWEIPPELLAPPPPPHRPDSTPVSMSTDVLLSMLMLSVKPNDGLRAGFVDVSAFVPEMWLSAFVLPFFLQVLETSPCRGGAAEIFNFSFNSLHFYLVTNVQSLIFCAASIGGGVEPIRRVAGIARRAIPTQTIARIARWGVPTITVAMIRLRSLFMSRTCKL
jgi:hypothetical protein